MSHFQEAQTCFQDTLAIFQKKSLQGSHRQVADKMQVYFDYLLMMC